VVTAKLDRLSRDVAFISGLMAQGVSFIVTVIPNARPVHAAHLRCRRRTGTRQDLGAHQGSIGRGQSAA
jgi:hypothetical protein